MHFSLPFGPLDIISVKRDAFVKSHVSPLLVGGEEGEGDNKTMKCDHLSPSPQPSPIKGEGAWGLFTKPSNLIVTFKRGGNREER
jgi:hypothetical protein